jgi:hypothetical protein
VWWSGSKFPYILDVCTIVKPLKEVVWMVKLAAFEFPDSVAVVVFPCWSEAPLLRHYLCDRLLDIGRGI